MKYYLCIDETGEFENKIFKNRPSSVGGFLCDENIYRELKTHLTIALKRHNNDAKNDPDYPGFDLRNDKLHYRVLHCGQDNLRPHKQWSYPANLGQQFIKILIDQLNGKIDLLCRTAGSPPLNLHPQHNYTVCLISLIAGVINDNKDIISKADELNIRIAKRSSVVLSGMAVDAPATYRELFINQVAGIISKINVTNKVKINVEIGDANKDFDLIIADLLLGVMTGRIYTDDIINYNYKIFDVNNFYHISLTDRPTELLTRLIESDKAEEAALLAVDYYNSSDDNQKNAGYQFLNITFPSLLREASFTISFTSILDARLNNILNERYTSPESLKRIRNITTLLIRLNEEKKIELSLPIIERCLYYLVHCEAHEGISSDSINSSYSAKYDTFFKESGKYIFPSLPDRINKRLETRLISVQTLYFNNFLFDTFISEFEVEISNYEKIFNKIHSLEKIDDLYARLCGTYGQAYGFQGSIIGDKKLIESAIDYINLDISYLPVNSIYRSQGYSFIITAYWMLDDLQRCRDSFRNYFGDIKNDEELADRIFSKSPFDPGSIFIYLDWLRYCELNDRLKGSRGVIAGIERDKLYKLANEIKKSATLYPFNLLIKWIAIIELRGGFKKRAIDLLKMINIKSSDDSVFYTMQTVINGMMIKRINDESIYDEFAVQSIKELADRYPGFAKFAEIKGLLHKTDMDVEELARLMPYYYS